MSYGEKQMNLSRICQEYAGHTKLLEEMGESVTYIQGLYVA
jgi:hypothetical protein